MKQRGIERGVKQRGIEKKEAGQLKRVKEKTTLLKGQTLVTREREREVRYFSNSSVHYTTKWIGSQVFCLICNYLFSLRYSAASIKAKVSPYLSTLQNLATLLPVESERRTT